MLSSTPFSIHPLAPDDVALMESILTIFGEAFDEVGPIAGPGPARPISRACLERLLHSARRVEERRVVAGGIAAYELRKFEQERSVIYIYDLAVAAAHRRQGIATALILELKKIAAARGAYAIFVQADLGDAPAIALYTKLGTREDVLHFDITITR